MQDHSNNSNVISRGDEAVATGYPSTLVAAPRLTGSPGTPTSWPKSTQTPRKDTEEDSIITTADHHIHIGSQTLARQSHGPPKPTTATSETTTRRSRSYRIGGGARFPANGFRPIISRDTYYHHGRDRDRYSGRGGRCASRSGDSGSRRTNATVPRREAIDGGRGRDEHPVEKRGLEPIMSPLAASACDQVVQDRRDESSNSTCFSPTEENACRRTESTGRGKRRSTRKVPVQPAAATEGNGYGRYVVMKCFYPSPP